jgi:hypothetical protein
MGILVVTLELYFEGTERQLEEISPSVFFFFNYLSTDGQFSPLEGISG